MKDFKLISMKFLVISAQFNEILQVKSDKCRVLINNSTNPFYTYHLSDAIPRFYHNLVVSIQITKLL